MSKADREKNALNPFQVAALAMLSFAVVAASSPTKSALPAPAGSASPPPAKSAPPLSKYERAHEQTMKISAPADEYFGKLKISFLGIDNTFRDASVTAGDHTTDPSVINKVEFAVDALKDWERKYPHDPQLARSYYFAIAAEKKIWVQAHQEVAWTYMNRIATVFPNTYFGKLIKREIAIGFTEHYYAEPVPCQTPAPTPTPSPEPTVAPPAATATPTNRRQPRATPSPVPTPAPTPTPAASPTLEPTPSPTPPTTQLAKGLKVQILTPPCTAPPTPTPSPTAAPTALPAPATSSPQPLTASTPASIASPKPSNSPSATASLKPA